MVGEKDLPILNCSFHSLDQGAQIESPVDPDRVPQMNLPKALRQQSVKLSRRAFAGLTA